MKNKQDATKQARLLNSVQVTADMQQIYLSISLNSSLLLPKYQENKETSCSYYNPANLTGFASVHVQVCPEPSYLRIYDPSLFVSTIFHSSYIRIHLCLSSATIWHFLGSIFYIHYKTWSQTENKTNSFFWNKEVKLKIDLAWLSCLPL